MCIYMYTCVLYINRIQEGINNPSRLITEVLSRTKIQLTYPQRFKYKMFFFEWTIE